MKFVGTHSKESLIHRNNYGTVIAMNNTTTATATSTTTIITTP